MIEKKIENLLLQKFTEDEFSDCFLIEINHSNKKLEVFIDSDTGITFKKCQRISRFLEQHLDENGWLGEKYVLDVSSPGTDRPLKLKRQYLKNIGRKLDVTLTEGEMQTGTLIAVDEDKIILEEKVRIKEGKKKRTEMVKTEILFEEIKKAIIKVTF